MPSHLTQLTEQLQKILAQAQLSLVEVPDTGGLQLYLLDRNFSLAALDSSTAMQVMNNPLYWLFCWASGRVMAQEIYRHPQWVQGKTVLDVGSGSGVVAIAAAKAGAKKVIASDIDSYAQSAIALNAQANQCSIDIIGDYREYQGEIDLITVADVLYDRENMGLLNALLAKAPVWLADSRIKNFSHADFVWQGQAKGETFPSLGGFDEFYQVNIYRSVEK